MGYAPIALPYNDSELHKHLHEKMKCISLPNRKQVIKLAKHTHIIQFVYEISKPILKYQDNGFVVQLGKTNDVSEIICAYPFIALFAGDNKQQNILCNIKNTIQSKGRKCRCCVDTECYLYGRDRQRIPLRDQTMFKTLTEAADNIQVKRYKNLTKQEKKRCTQDELAIIIKTKEYNYIPCINRLILFANVLPFHFMFPADKLHSLIEGVIKNVIEWTAIIIFLIDIICKKESSHRMGILDIRIKNFPYRQSLYPFEKCHFTQGFSYYFNQSYCETLTKGTGFMTKRLPGWKLPSLLFQLMFAIGTEDTILPNTKQWTILANLRQECNINKIVLDAIQSTISLLIMYNKNDGYTEKEFKTLQNLLTENRMYVSNLWILKCDLYNNSINNPKNTQPSIFGGIKHHLIERHEVEWKKHFGTENNTYNVELSEHYHLTCKNDYEATSKRFESTTMEMMKIYKRR